ncbi:MAG: hypothetical protein COB15_06355 [Flavobacteriales bacterium]|nr:MAG: hypothetical protein COB15_06355 [Flavobacteriales bacterium]
MKKSILTLGILIAGVTVSYGQSQTFDEVKIRHTPNSNGIKFYSGSDDYKIHYGATSEFQFGPVTSSSIKNTTSQWGGKGWTWGVSSWAPVAALDNNGEMSIKGNFFTEKKMSIGKAYTSGLEYQLEIEASSKAIKIDATPTGSWQYGIRVNVANNTYSSTYKPFAVFNGTNQVFTVQGDGTTRIGNVLYAQEVFVQNDVWPDFVFEKDYSLNTLYEVEKFITENSHLPDVPSAKEVEENGVAVSDMSAILLQKIEELTLYTIAQQKKIDELEQLIKQ